MRRGTPRVAVVAVVLLLSMLAACSGHKGTGSATSTTVRAKPPASASHTILDFINGDSDLTSLAALVRGTTFEKLLRGKGPLTLFAPTNEALSALPAQMQDQLHHPDTLTKVLDLHIVQKRVTAAELIPLAGSTLGTMGASISVAIDGRTLRIGGAAVTRTDILASNGVIHEVGGLVTATG